MKKSTWLLALGMAASLLPTAPASAADHRDGAATLTDPSTDINDVYSWVDPAGGFVYLAMTVFPAAAQTSQFSNSAYYVFHTSSRATFAATTATNLDIICGFDSSATQNISCWFGDSTNFVYGAAGNAAAPLTSNNITIYAGARKDHFFFNLDGFNKVRANLKGALTGGAGALVFNANATGCINTIGGATTVQAAQVAQLKSFVAPQTVVTDFFAPLNTLAIVLKVPVAIVNKGGAFMSVSAATHRKG